MEYYPHTGFHYSKLLTYLCHDYGIFSNISGQIYVGVSKGRFINGLGFRNVFNTKLHGLGAC